MPVAIVYPDQGRQQIGTLFIPNTLALIKDSPHQKEAEKLLDYLLSADVESRLAAGPSAQIPLRPGVAASPRVKTPPRSSSDGSRLVGCGREMGYDGGILEKRIYGAVKRP